MMALLIFTCLSCSEKLFTGDVDCDSCFTDKPDHTYLVIHLTINDQFPEVPIVVYKGDVENNDVFKVDTVTASPYDALYVPADDEYSVKAEYKKGDKTLFAIDGTKIKILKVSDACDSPCYIIEHETLDVRIDNSFLSF